MEILEKYPQRVQEIHRAVTTSGDKLVEEAQAIVEDRSEYNVEKVNRLRNFGFENSVEAKQLTVFNERNNSVEQAAKLCLKYKTLYPKYPFVTVEQIDAICKKYKLVRGSIDRFTGFIPERNLSEIEEAEKIIKHHDPMVRIDEIKYDSDAGDGRVKRYLRKVKGIIRESEILRDSGYSSIDYHVVKGFLLKKANGKTFFPNDIKYTRLHNLEICAPRKDFNLKGATVIGGVIVDSFMTLFTEMPKDPVVLHRVPGGFLAETAWGEEANDPILKVEE